MHLVFGGDGLAAGALGGVGGEGGCGQRERGGGQGEGSGELGLVSDH